MSIRTLSAKTAFELDSKLMGDLGYTLDQLMELAGLSAAQSVYKFHSNKTTPITVLCGPGNNGGDGLVCARHLKLFGYLNVYVYWPKHGKTPFYLNLEKQLGLMDIPIIKDSNFDKFGLNSLNSRLSNAQLIIDALFGFSFHPPLRDPYDDVINLMIQNQQLGGSILAIDVPSGWDVDLGPTANSKYTPDALVSLTAPKKCSQRLIQLNSNVKHYLGGRFIPQKLATEWGFDVNVYNEPNVGIDQVVDITHLQII